MPTQLLPNRHLEGLREAMLAFVRYGDRAGLDARVPTCPGWSLRELIAHQGMVHRWATANLRGERTDPDTLERAGLTDPDPLEWLADGAIDLVTAWTQAPADVATVVFLNDAPGPKQFWARRQCHETTIHAVDALAASLGRPPKAEEVWVDAELAADGIDELLCGFLTRSKSRLRSDEPGVLVVAPDDREEWWEVSLSPQPAVSSRRTDLAPADADWVLTGPAVDLYLRLWNRGADAVDVAGWAERAPVTWA
ncbi:maleylpyruvate isomerase family mycothiol-dependent enzyme [Nocardioides sp. CER19]|uniref:maleylpyruvate isomerase family mycothiol-dependent enzyme n=1 Tax=Nocardioides sp. CER19 TaxID=3038538 RepID=UPI00244CAB4F|nr:maleylpyruvate isomerase family mycothiol-dependent enzyme [Nocardioides sp. CER19]MDH2412921.1 maleylpyruvate isomerase family mycothiol-dependent enzyme [Nocardioides sp. CER19]